ncbi:Alpha/Beta hydrolase protein [Lophiotrema nucula]|uniref:Carboxylic ester hydrolase n=1 Tax=Lophiotrema nucula TaxID=690887 RepID=A0A6A5YF38_9PLEO|nr:Alpha/Beta hydrolase protein [Lophiotrema nucula]
MAFFFVWILALFVQQLVAVDSVVDLGYVKYRGSVQNDGVTTWLGMRYARSTSRVDGRRFTAPEDPMQEVGGIQDAAEFGPLCIGTGTHLKLEFRGNFSEDCLFANVFAPTNASSKSKLPVYIFIQGGGFNLNGNANYNGSKLIQAADYNMVVVNFNYRVGPYGFLASKEVVANKTLSLNNGLKDQRQLMRWVKAHIDKFGGDPNHVTLGGASAGAASVVFHLTAYGGRDDKLFQAAAAESQGFPAIRNVKDSQFAYDALLKQTKCKDLACMSSMNAVDFQQAVRSIKMPYPGGKNPPIWFWNPTLDYDFIRNWTYHEINAGHLVNVPTIFGDATNEGTIFTPNSVISQQRAETFVGDQYVNFNKTTKDVLEGAFPGPLGTTDNANWKTVAANIYGHIRYTCPGLNVSAAYARYGSFPTYQYRWNVGGALHVGELGSIWNNGTSAAGDFAQNYWQSFIRSYDPNKSAATFNAKSGKVDSPKWEAFGTGGGNRLLFGDNNVVKMETVTQQERTQCQTIYGLGMQMQQ